MPKRISNNQYFQAQKDAVARRIDELRDQKYELEVRIKKEGYVEGTELWGDYRVVERLILHLEHRWNELDAGYPRGTGEEA